MPSAQEIAWHHRNELQMALMKVWQAQEPIVRQTDGDWAEPPEGYEKSCAMAFRCLYERYGDRLSGWATEDSSVATAWLAKLGEVKARLERGEVAVPDDDVFPGASGDQGYARAA